MKNSPRLWTLPFALVILVGFLFFLSLQMLTAGFPVYVTSIFHHPAEGGLMTSAFMLAAIFTRPVIGILIHKMNIKWTIGASLFAVLCTMIIVYGREALPFIIVIRIFQGIGFGIVTTLLATLATELIPRERLGEGIGYFGMATSLGTTLGPMFALYLLNIFPFKTLLLITFSISLIALIFSLSIKNGPNEPANRPISKDASIWAYAFDKKALLPSFLVMLFYITFSGIVNFINGLGGETNLGEKVSLFFLVSAIVMVIIRPFSGRFYDQYGHRLLIYVAGLSGILGLLLLMLTHNLILFTVSAIFYGLAYGIMQPTFQAWAVSRVSADKKATANAMTFSFMDLGMASGAALGLIAGHSSYHMMYGYSSILIIILLIIYTISQLSLSQIFKSKEREDIA